MSKWSDLALEIRVEFEKAELAAKFNGSEENWEAACDAAMQAGELGYTDAQSGRLEVPGMFRSIRVLVQFWKEGVANFNCDLDCERGTWW